MTGEWEGPLHRIFLPRMAGAPRGKQAALSAAVVGFKQQGRHTQKLKLKHLRNAVFQFLWVLRRLKIQDTEDGGDEEEFEDNLKPQWRKG